MPGAAIELPPGVYHGIDTVQAVTERQAAILADSGITWVGRYLAQDERRPERPDDSGGDWWGCWTLSNLEVARLGGADLLVQPLQWGASGADRLQAELGHQWGTHQVRHARHLGIPDGVHLWGDTEGRRVRVAGLAAATAHVEAHAAAQVAGGYQGGHYFATLPREWDAHHLYGLRGVTRYHLAAQGDLPSPEPRGLSIRQYLLRAPLHPDPEMRTRCPHAGDYCPIRYGAPPGSSPRCPLDLRDRDPLCFVPIGLAYDPDRMIPCVGPAGAEQMPVLWAPGRP